MKEPKFKKGDILIPIKTGISNYHILKNLEKVEVLNADICPSYSKKLISVKILKGYITHANSYNNYREGQVVNLYEDAFSLEYDESTDYSIF